MFSFLRQLLAPARAKRSVFAAALVFSGVFTFSPPTRAARSPLPPPAPVEEFGDDLEPAEQAKPGKWGG